MQFFFILLFIALPWLNPFAPGPTPAALPLLFSWVCAAVLWGISSHISSQSQSLSVRLVLAIVWAWLLAGLLSGFIGLCQYYGVAHYFSPGINLTETGQAYANLRQRNLFATLTSISLAALLWLAAGGHVRPRFQWLILVAAALLAVGNAASSSRTGLVQLALLCILAGLWGGWRHKEVRSVLFTAVLVYGVAVLALPWLAGLDLSLYGITARLLTGDELCASRLTLWSNVLHLIAQKPWLGWGWGELDYAHYITLYDGPRFCGILDNAHNLPLHLAVELGVPVALMACGGFMWWVLRQKPWRETDPTRQLAWSVMAVILLHSMLEYPLWYGPFQMAFGLCIGLLWRVRDGATDVAVKSGSIKNGPAVHVFRLLSVVALIVMIGYAAWDYRRISQIYLAPQERDAAYRDDTLVKIQGSWFFADQVRFAQLLLTPLTRDTAQWSFKTATALLHYSPEPRVIEKVIESAAMLDRNDEALMHLARYRAAFPEDYARWNQGNAQALSGLLPPK